MLQPVKEAFGDYMGRFYAELLPTTKPLERFCTRGLAASIAWAPSRMVDAAEEMLGQWLRFDPNDATTKPPEMPAIIVAVARDYMPTGRDWGRQIADPEWITFPDDAKNRAFKLRTVAGEIRAQVVIFAQDEPTAKSLAAQFLLFMDGRANRGFMAAFSFAGFAAPYPVVIETPEIPFVAVSTEAKNLTILAGDVTLKATIPLFYAPKVGEPNDGQGTPGSATDPAGFPVMGGIVFSGKAVP